MYLNSPANFLRDKTTNYYVPNLCAFVEDYRTGTIFDAIGSIGGLLALLQGVHILLFGRPLFWGFAGAKLISSFGVFGRCHSRGFRRRLRERYHRQPTSGQAGDPLDTIRMEAFLRDFVIDLGPADVDSEEDIELGRSEELKEPYPQDNRNRFHGEGKYDPNSTIPLLLHPGADRRDSQGRTTPVDGIGLK
ncbi:hypothetical protein FRC09_020478 [Ceratobasidium sp. 395]|nr:hypothetical protein FRC09_020478 [Ceratobasidium sp. 395]